MLTLPATRNILFSGAYGSGKTSLARILATAWNCDHLNEHGSPCKECYDRFEADPSVLFEYDVAGKGGSVEQIRGILRNFEGSPRGHRVRMIIFDEAHALTPLAEDALLKAVEQSAPGVSFCFATTQPWNIGAPLRSRLLQMIVRPLATVDSVLLLRRVAISAGITCNTDALILLAGLKRGHPRDLLNGLEQVALGQAHVTLAAVKQCFDIDQDEHVVAYFLALAAGDQGAQQLAFDAWRDALDVKVGWIRAFLLSLYHRDVLGQDVMIDAVTDAIIDGRVEILRRFGDRLGVGQPSELAPPWRRLLSFWLMPIVDDDASLRLHLALFEDLVNRGLHDLVEMPGGLRTLPIAKADHATAQITAADVSSLIVPDTRESTHAASFFDPCAVRTILRRSSFFTQHHGGLMNASVIVTPSPKAIRTESSAVTVVRKFRSDLNTYLARDSRASAHITVLDSSEIGVVGRIITHVPMIEDGTIGMDAFRAWCLEWPLKAGDSHDVYVSISDSRASNKFHWRALADLAAGMDDSDEGGDNADSSLARDLIVSLKVPPGRRRYQGALTCPMVEMSESLSAAAVEDACEYAMPILSAFDDHALNWVTRGWEQTEFHERKEEIRRRVAALDDLKNIHADDAVALVAALNAEIGRWPTDAKMRPRKAQYWWNNNDA